MTLTGEQVLLRIYLQSADRPPHTPTYERIVRAARQRGMAGATVLHGILGAGDHGMMQPSNWTLVRHMPVIVEIVDDSQRIINFVKQDLDPLMVGGMLTLERAAVMRYRPGAPDKTAPGKIAPPPPAAPLELAKPLQPLSTMPRFEPGDHMTVNQNGVLLRVFIGESDRFEHKPLYEAIVQKAREVGVAGATVLRGAEGFGAHSVVHKTGLLEMSSDLPIIIEIVDEEPKIKLLLPHLEQMVGEGMITMEYVMVLLYRHGDKK